MIKARYTGAGRFYDGVPARDLSPEEYAALSEEQRRLVDSGVIYETRPTRRVRPPVEEAAEMPPAPEAAQTNEEVPE